MTSTTNLLPCPFCGNAPIVTGPWEIGTSDTYEAVVECKHCSIQASSTGGTVFNKGAAAAAATEKWNRRTVAPCLLQIAEPVATHPDDAAVDALAALMKAKLENQRAKGYAGWNTAECTQQRLSEMLRDHVTKGDPVDVANFCAFLSSRGEGIAAAPQAALAAVPESRRIQFESWARSFGDWVVQRDDDQSLGTTGYTDMMLSLAWAAVSALTAPPTPAAGVPAAAPDALQLLGEDHDGMRVDYSGLLGQVQREITRTSPGHAEMIRQLKGHMKELGQGWYAGSIAVVDEFLQLYCVENEARAAIAAQAKGEQA